jgi:hypothetical protein
MFKVGDKVKCVSKVSALNCLNLTDNKVYAVTRTSLFGGLCVTDDKGLSRWLGEWRFELVNPEPQETTIAEGLQEHNEVEYCLL